MSILYKQKSALTRANSSPRLFLCLLLPIILGAVNKKTSLVYLKKQIRKACFLTTCLTTSTIGLHGNSSTQEHENVRFG